jgi:hypothetical protein
MSDTQTQSVEQHAEAARSEALAFLENLQDAKASSDAGAASDGGQASGDGGPDGNVPVPETPKGGPGVQKAASVVVDEPAAEPGTEPAAETNRIAAVLRAKKQAQQVRDKAQAEYEAKLRELEQRDQALREREQKWSRTLREKPIDGLRELGIEPREFFEKAVADPKELDPVTQLRHEFQQERQARMRLEQQLAERDKHAEERQRQGALQAEKQRFVSTVFSAGDKFPALQAFYEDSPGDLAEDALRVVNDFVSRGGDPSDITNDDIAEYLEQQKNQYFSLIRSRLERVGSQADQPADGVVSISNAQVARKASRPKKTVEEMSTEEAREEALKLLEEPFERARKLGRPRAVK